MYMYTRVQDLMLKKENVASKRFMLHICNLRLLINTNHVYAFDFSFLFLPWTGSAERRLQRVCKAKPVISVSFLT